MNRVMISRRKTTDFSSDDTRLFNRLAKRIKTSSEKGRTVMRWPV